MLGTAAASSLVMKKVPIGHLPGSWSLFLPPQLCTGSSFHTSYLITSVRDGQRLTSFALAAIILTIDTV